MSDRPVKRMNIREKMEAVLKAQEEEERKRIEKTKFTRMTVEQQEIYLAKQRQVRICCLMETGRFKTTQEIRSKFNFHSGCVIFLNKMEYKTLC